MSSGIEEFLNDFSQEICSLSSQLRALIVKTAPGANEKLNLGWKVISYDAFCAIAPHSKWVNLQFHKGASLEDPSSLLEGTGKAMRHVKIYEASDIDDKLAKLIKQAATLS